MSHKSLLIMSLSEVNRHDVVRRGTAMTNFPWETESFKVRQAHEFASDAPHFHCEECLEIIPVHLGCYKDEADQSLCRLCFDPDTAYE